MIENIRKQYIKTIDKQIEIDSSLEEKLDELARIEDEANKLMTQLREDLLASMKLHNVEQIKLEHYTISQVIPKDVITFDDNKFVSTENEQIVAAFIEIQTNETLNIDKLIAENSDLVKKYTETIKTAIVDTKSLEKTLPTIYEKYVNVEKSKKDITLRIARKK